MRVIRKILIAIAFGAMGYIALFFAGTMLPRNVEITITDTIQAPTESITQRITNVEDYPLWRDAVKEVVTYSENQWLEVSPTNDTILFRMNRYQGENKIMVQVISDYLPYQGYRMYKWQQTQNNNVQLTITDYLLIESPWQRLLNFSFETHKKALANYYQRFISGL